MTERNKKLLLLCILDGWGYTGNTKCNAIHAANTPVWDDIWGGYPHTLIETHGARVGLPAGQMGNSEVGHIHIGAGRVIYQEYTRISRSISTGSFFSNKTLTEPVDRAVANNSAVHILGLLSDGGVHSHSSHINAMVKLAVSRGAKKVYVHAFLDGRDTPPKSAEKFLSRTEDLISDLKVGKIASIVGRYYAMDRDKRWERVEKAYNLLAHGTAEFKFDNAVDALRAAYLRGESDEFVLPSVTCAEKVRIKNGDAVFFMNYRTDRTRELTESFTFSDFNYFDRGEKINVGSFTTLTQYHQDYRLPVAFPPQKIINGFGEYIANMGLRQLRIAETEKYAHVTFFFNGGEERVFPGEDRILVNSPMVATYDLKPEMSAFEVTAKLVAAIKSQKYDVIICNYANSDMVGHTGKFDAALAAIATLDECLGKVRRALKEVEGEMLVTADHGNSEQMCDYETGDPLTSHTTNLTPLVYVGEQDLKLADKGSLADIAPTMLELLELPLPMEMNGHSLLVR